MLYLRTGTPGAGKTLNTIKELDIENAPDPKNPDKVCRTIYYYNIELYPEKLKANWVYCDNPEEWYNYPQGSIIFIDEAQEIFPSDGKRDRPLKISKFERHRHQGFDVHLITQHPSLISPHVKQLVGKHVHYYRPFGGNRIKKFVFEFCVSDPQAMSNRALAQVFNIKLDKKYFEVYKSAVSHTHKYKMPKHYYLGFLAVAVLLACSFFAYQVVNNFAGDDDTKEVKPSVASTANDFKTASKSLDLLPNSNELRPMTKGEYINSLKPRLKDYPASAPRYDEINKPVVMPKPSCVSSMDENRILKAKLTNKETIYKGTDGEYLCQCYSQQGSKLNISGEACLAYVENGYFDDTKPDKVNYNVLSQAHGRAPAEREPEITKPSIF